MLGLTHENEMFPKIKEGEKEGEAECAEQAGTEENEWINSLPHPHCHLLSFPPSIFPKALGFITKHAELVGTNRLYKHP